MIKFLSQPYPFENSFAKRTVVSIGISAFVFLFLFIFKPFELGTYPGSQLLLSLGYGLVTFIVMTLFNVVTLFSFKNYFNETVWTTSKELFWMLLLISIIGISNTLYTMILGIGNFNFYSILYFEFYTLTIGFFPVSVSTLINYYRLKSGYEKNSEEINDQLTHLQHNSEEKNSNVSNQIMSDEKITFTAENGKDIFEFNVNAIQFIRSADNYIEVFYSENNHKISNQLIRSTLKKCEMILEHYDQFFKCHKSYLVNLQKVKKVSGNAQGYKLHLENVDELIPVSRIHNDTIKTKLSGL